MESPLAVPNTFDVFFWMTWLGTILFQGALHSCILLLLKAWKYEHAGTRWAKVIWINFFWIGCFLGCVFAELLHFQKGFRGRDQVCC